MRTLHSIAELRKAVAKWRMDGEEIAFVPTMGNLHRGHVELVRHGRQLAPRIVASVFVNPLQFGPTEDFDRYPRTLAEDQVKLKAAKADVLFAPTVREIYPAGLRGQSRISVPQISTILCGHFRPGHFDGGATVANLLLNIVQPDYALFGEKCFERLLVIRRMVGDLLLPVKIVGVPTQREPDGLALSSRNQYLSKAQGGKAPKLSAALLEIAKDLRVGKRNFASLEKA